MKLSEVWTIYKKRPAYLAALVVGFASTLAIGPQFQTYSVALLTSQEDSIYSSVYSTDMVLFPALGEWLIGSWAWIFYPMSALIVACTIQRTTARSMFITGWVAAFVVLEVADLASSIVDGALSAESMFVNSCANFFGAPLVVSVLLLFLAGSEFLERALEGHPILRRITVVLCPVVLGLLVEIAAYYLITLFYNPTNSRVHVVARAPTAGMFSTLDLRWPVGGSDASRGEKPRFAVFGEDARLPKSFIWYGHALPLSINWSRTSKNHFDVSVWVTDGCDSGKKLDARATPLKFKDVEQVVVHSDEGPIDVRVGRKGSDDGYFKSPGVDPEMYWIEQGDKKDTIRLSTFSSGEEKLNYWDPMGGLRVEVSNILMNKARAISDRTITAKIDGHEERFVFQPNRKAKWKDASVCKVLTPQSSGEAYQSTTVQSGIVIEIAPIDDSIGASADRRAADQMEISGVNGWIVADELRPEDVANYVTSGHMGLIRFNNGVSSVELNGTKLDIDPADQLLLHYADVTGEIGKNGELVVSGRASAIYKNDARANLTRWERLEWPARGTLLAGVPGVLLWLASTVIGLLRRNHRFSSLD